MLEIAMSSNKKKGSEKVQLNPPAEIKESLMAQARYQGISLNAYLTPLLSAVARGEIRIMAGKVEIAPPQKPPFPLFG